MSIRFSEASHRYWLDGKPVTGVTTLIKNGLPAPALTHWAAKSVAEYVAGHREQVEALWDMPYSSMVNALKAVPWDKRDRAGERGTEVHRLAHALVMGEEVRVPNELAGYVASAVAFMDDYLIAPIASECPVAHREHWWAGTPDLFADYRLPSTKTCGRGLFDYKTADSGIWPETAFQLSAYRRAEFWQDPDGQEHEVPEVGFTAAVWLQPDRYEVIPLNTDDNVYAEFRHIAYVADTTKRMKDYVLPALSTIKDSEPA